MFSKIIEDHMIVENEGLPEQVKNELENLFYGIYWSEQLKLKKQ